MPYSFAKVLRKTRSGLQTSTSRSESREREREQHLNVDDVMQWGEMNRGRSSKLDDRAYDPEGASERSVQWFKDTMGMDDKTARESAEAFLYFSHHGDYEAHRNIGKGVKTNDLLDRAIEAPNAPVYTGVQHRGLLLTKDDIAKTLGTKRAVSPREYINTIISSGVWKEPGATSFGTSGYDSAKSWAKVLYPHTDGEVSVIVEYAGGKSGFPMAHLSRYPGEREALHSRKQMRKGMPITGHKWSSDGKLVTIYVTDKRY